MWKYLKCRATGRFASSEQLASVLLQMGAEDTRVQMEVRARAGCLLEGERGGEWTSGAEDEQVNVRGREWEIEAESGRLRLGYEAGNSLAFAEGAWGLIVDCQNTKLS